MWRYPLGQGFTSQQTANFLTRQVATQDLHEVAPLAAEDRFTQRLLGYVGLGVPHFLPEILPAVEIGWRLDPLVWGRGLATEGAAAILKHAFAELNVEEVVSIYHPENGASGKVMMHLGMQFDRDTVDPAREIALRVYRLSKKRWRNSSNGCADG